MNSKAQVAKLLVLAVLLLVMGYGLPAKAAPEAHILRIDPRTAVLDGNPVLTTVIDLTQSKRVGEVTAKCGALRGDKQLDCISDALEEPGSLAKPFAFVPDDVLFSVRVDDTDFPATLLSHTTFAKSQNDPGVGTAWLLIVDADDRMGKGLDEATALATQFMDSMGAHDLVNLIILSDKQIVFDSKWLSRRQLRKARKALKSQEDTIRSQGRTRPLLDLIKRAASDSFRALGSPEEGQSAPLHQAMVVISSGFGGGDPSTTGPGASKLAEYFTKGRFDSENTALPKLPIAVVSIYVPPKTRAEHRDMARTFMQNLANPSIGGFFTILRDGQEEHVGRIVDTVRSRFADLIIARFRLSCVAPTTTQSFSLLFKNKSVSIAGDATFQDVPVGFDPSSWPLDMDAEMTRKKALDAGGIRPGGKLRVFGNFCWGGDLARPEVYFLPPGEALPQELSSKAGSTQSIQKRLTSLDMRATALQVSSSFAEFLVPDTEQILHGEAERQVVRIIVVDAKMQRTSGSTEATVLTLKGAEKALVWWPFAAGGAGGVLLLLLAGLFVRRGTRKSDEHRSGDRSRLEESPYATPSPISRSPRQKGSGYRATLEGAAGRFIVPAASEIRCGRDGSRCAAVIKNPQVSGLHATFRMEGQRLLVRDEGSSSGTRLASRLLEPGKWEEAIDGDEVAIGPEVLRVSLGPST